MRKNIVILFLFLAVKLSAQNLQTDWYILESNSVVTVIKPGVNDLTLHMAKYPNKPLDTNAVKTMMANIKFTPGNIVLVHAKVGDTYLATDMEGRNLLVKGPISRVSHGGGSGIGYMKESYASGGTMISREAYVWVCNRNKSNKDVTVQVFGNKTINVPADKVYDINALMLNMASGGHRILVK